MAVRIALHCSEADSQLILDDTNVAARLLTRPGEAIYNDAGGLVEGNSPFQTAWLPDDERADYLEDVCKLARERGAGQRDAMLAAGVAPNMAWKWEKQLGRYRLPELRRANRRMLQAESELKGGLRVDARWIVEGAIRDVIRG